MTKKMIHSIYTTMFPLICITLSLSSPATAQQSDNEPVSPDQTLALFTGEITLSQLIDHALQNNPSIRIARQKWQSTVEQYPVATSLPDPQFMATYFPKPIETRMGPQDWNASISQMLPFPGKLGTLGKLVETDAAVARLNTDAAARQVAAKVAASFHELLYIRKAVEITNKNVEMLEEFRLMAETEHSNDRTVFMDVIKAHSKLGQVRYDILLLKELEQTEITVLNALLNRPLDALVGELMEPDLPDRDCSLERLYRMAGEAQEEIAISRLNVKKAQIGVDLAKYSRRPNFKLGLFYASIGDPDVAVLPADAGEDVLGVQFGVNFPIWSDRNSSKMTQAGFRVLQERAAVEKTVNSVRTRIRSLHFKLNNSRRLITLYAEELLPQALQSMALAGSWFREGEGTFSDFVEVQASVYNFQLSLARARADYGKTLALLQPLVGHPIDGGCIPRDSNENRRSQP